MKENKEFQIKVRITAKQKEEITKYCDSNDINISQFLRMAIDEILSQKEK